MKLSGIYKIESKIKPEKIYIGSAVNIADRWRCHLKELRKNTHHNPKLQCHFNKYGESDFTFSILLGCDKEYLIVNEQFFIDSYKPWFNCRPLANSSLGYRYSDEIKKKMGASKIGRKLTEEHKLKCSKALKGRVFTEDHKRNMSLALMGHKSWNKGIKLTEEQKERIYTDEVRSRMNQDKKGKKLSEAHRKNLKLAKSNKKYKKAT